MDTTNLSTLNIVQSNDGNSSIDGVIDWSQIEIASQPPMTTTESPARPTFNMMSSSNVCQKKLTPKRKKQ